MPISDRSAPPPPHTRYLWATLLARVYEVFPLRCPRFSVRKIWIAFSEAYPYARLFQAVLDRLRQIPLTC